MNNEIKITTLRQLVSIVGLLSTPFFIAFALGCFTTFQGGGDFFIEALNDPSTSKLVFIVGLVGAVITYSLRIIFEHKLRVLMAEKSQNN